MRKSIKILLVVLLGGFAIPASAQGPVGYLNFATFSTPSGQNFFETYLSMVGSSFKFVKNDDKQFIAKAHVTLRFFKGDSLVAFANFNLLSPEVSDTTTKPNFVDVHRFWLAKGNYTMKFTLDDASDSSHKTISEQQAVRVGYPGDTVNISDAEFLTAYTPSNTPGPFNKCGFNMVPYVFTNYPQSVTRLCFYCEIYNTVKFIPHQKFTVKYTIVDDNNQSFDLAQNFVGASQLNADTVVPFLAKVPIGSLPTGRYGLVVSVIDLNNHVLARRKYVFTKENPGVKSNAIPQGFAVYMATRDTLEESIRCLAPISQGDEQPYVMSDSLHWVSMAELKHFFYYFWYDRDSLHPYEAWQKYLGQVIRVNNSYNMRGLKGYRTDRGRVYLQYGPPNIMAVEKNNPATYPHEIWEYYKLPDGETDVKFVFYSTAIETNNYVLLHSTATGELHNPQWQSALYSTIGTGLPANLDNEQVQDQLGEDVNDEFNNPH